jgi:membrane associated rhomboid family serine protease
MIPLRDNVARHRLSPVNTLLIAANVAVFTQEVSLGPHLQSFVARFAMVPVQITRPVHRVMPLTVGTAHLWPPLTLLTSLFIHGSVAHIAGNMLYLFIFGPAVEERTGHLRYLCFYLLCGIASGVATVVMAPDSYVPVIGASGAIAGVLGAYFILYPHGRILTLFPPLFLFELPALIYLIVWFAAQLYWGIESGVAGALMGGVAWWAHVGGFLFGIAAGPLVARAPERRRVTQR